ncbi:MAG TPA: beta-L-arabinofuranosidase domain-containing protein [Terracidiphilus sp.]|jgi:hypothetical protein|nr:beta-L-arabinofuranosidase domain-containing protein [Terracidiphilus sp.]
MHRRDFCELLAAVACLGLPRPSFAQVGFESGSPTQSTSPPAQATADANYANSRLPLLPTAYLKLPLGASRPAGWLLDQLTVQANGLTSHLPEVWNIIAESAWKGDAEKHVTPECCTARFVPRWLEGLTALAGVLDDGRLKTLAKPYMDYILAVHDLAFVTSSACAWSHLGRFLPEYYELTGDERAVSLARRILDYADSVRDTDDMAVVDPARLGMLLSFGVWHYNRTGDRSTLALLERCTNRCVADWKQYFVHFPENPKYWVHFPDQTAEKSNDEPPSHWTRHGVNVTQAIQYPAQYYLISHDESDKDCIQKGLANLDEGYGQVGGRWNADEWLASTDPVQGTELCDVEELLFSLEKSFEVIGDLAMADRIEQLMFNAFPGTCTADMWAHQYDQQANQVLVSVARRPWHLNDETSNIYGFTPNFPCCLSNMHSPWPRYVESMWMATPDKGLVAALYGPCRVRAKVGDSSEIEIIEETNYPFSSDIRVTLRMEHAIAFPMHFRIPSWAVAAELHVTGESQPYRPQSGSLFKIERVWKSGEVVTLHFNFKVRAETRRNNAVSIALGPLYFVLRIGEAFRPISELAGLPTPPGCVNWRIDPTTDWNYALVIDRKHPHCTMTTSPISSMPFAQKDEPVKLPNANEFAPWRQDVPIVLQFKARRVPQWGMKGANAAPVPVSPVSTDSPETFVELIPYGCSKLRIAEFPTV